MLGVQPWERHDSSQFQESYNGVSLPPSSGRGAWWSIYFWIADCRTLFTEEASPNNRSSSTRLKEEVHQMEKNTKNHPFTVVIPTRERCDTLEHALHTCVIQDYDNLEILVCDNFSQDRTRDVVESFKDSRIRYINSGERLSMADNYEFALSHVRPEGYVVYIGDDDALLPNAICDINEVIVRTGTSVLRWDIAAYTWPSYLNTEGANNLYIPLKTAEKRRRSASAINDVLSFKANYQSLPVMYMYSAVAHEVLQRIKNASGRFYHSINPDVYSGFAIAGAVDSFIDSRRPYAIGGVSKHSIGVSAQSGRSSPEAANKFFNENTIPFHSDLIDCKSLVQYVIEAFLQAKDHLDFLQPFTLDKKKLLHQMMKDTSRMSEDAYDGVRDAVLKIGEMHGISEAADAAIRANPPISARSRNPMNISNLGKHGSRAVQLLRTMLGGGRLCVDCNHFSVKNVYDASIFTHHVLKLREMHVTSCLAAQKSECSRLLHALSRRFGRNRK